MARLAALWLCLGSRRKAARLSEMDLRGRKLEARRARGKW